MRRELAARLGALEARFAPPIESHCLYIEEFSDGRFLVHEVDRLRGREALRWQSKNRDLILNPPAHVKLFIVTCKVKTPADQFRQRVRELWGADPEGAPEVAA